VPQLHEASGVVEREWAEEHGVYDAKDCSVRSDAEGEDDDGGCGEAGVFHQNTEAVFEIREKVEHAQFYLRTDKRGMGMKCFEIFTAERLIGSFLKAGAEVRL
jgi:hypothetical protein